MAALLQSVGLQLAYEPTIQGLTPDLVVYAGSSPSAIVEVANRLLPDDLAQSSRQWAGLRDRVERIGVPWAIRVVDPARSTGPTDAEAKAWVHDIQLWMESDAFDMEHGLRLGDVLLAPVVELPGTHATLVLPSNEIWTSSDGLVDLVETKVRRYSTLSSGLGIPLVVAMAADRRHPINVDTVRSMMSGKLTLTANLSMFPGPATTSKPIRLHPTDEPRTWDPALAAVSWIDVGIDEPGDMFLFPAPTAHAVHGMPVGPHVVEVA